MFAFLLPVQMQLAVFIYGHSWAVSLGGCSEMAVILAVQVQSTGSWWCFDKSCLVVGVSTAFCNHILTTCGWHVLRGTP